MKDMYNDSIYKATELAKADKENLVPFLGAGISIPLGLPDWNSFIKGLSFGTGINIEQNSFLDPREMLQCIKERQTETEFNLRVQKSLTLPSRRTSLTLLALTRTNVKRIVTTNLDYSIEDAFEMSGKPIHHSQLFCSHSDLNLGTAITVDDSVQLFKIHGTIDSPHTWVLTRSEYDEVYKSNNNVEEFIRHLHGIPFFIGCSHTDQDIKYCLRVANVRNKKRSFAIMPRSKAESFDRELKSYGVIPIYFHTYDQIPEIIDDVFGVSKLQVFDICELGTGYKALSFSGIKVEFYEENSRIYDNEKKFLVDVFSNALEGRPQKSLLDGKSRRQTGEKGRWKSAIQEHFKRKSNNDNECFTLIANSLRQCPELMIDGLLPSMLTEPKIDHYSAIKTILNVLDTEQDLKNIILLKLEGQIGNVELPLSALRAIAKILGEEESHPAQAIPPSIVEVGDLLASTYLLTNYQVGFLYDNIDLIKNNPIRPYVLRSQEEGIKIIEKLNLKTQMEWRIPTYKEWLFIAGRDRENKHLPEKSWPWGDSFPVKSEHAHLNFCNTGSGLADHPLEVGVFPIGKSNSGLFDVVGNVYEICTHESGYLLAGGSWSTKYRGEAPKSFRWITNWGAGSGNVGIRPICSKK